jgi:small-conductance mechanosensitive channel
MSNCTDIGKKKCHNYANVTVFDTIKTKAKRDTDKVKSLPDTGKIKKIELKQVSIKGKKVYIIQHVDKTIIQVENNEAFKGSSLNEILEKVPGVTIDGNNKLSITL